MGPSIQYPSRQSIKRDAETAKSLIYNGSMASSTRDRRVSTASSAKA